MTNYEKLEYKIKELQTRENSLTEEFDRLMEVFINRDDTTDVSALSQQIRDNIKNQRAILNEYRQAYKDFLNIKK